MNTKKIYLKNSQSGVVRDTVREVVGAVKSTMGPSGTTVLVESNNELGGYTSTKDGYTVAKDIFYTDPVKNIVAQVLKEASANTNVKAGDSTTTTMVLIEGILESFDEHVTEGVNKTEVLRALQRMVDAMVKGLKKKSTKMGEKAMIQLATTSANNDPVLGRLIGELFQRTGHVTVQYSKDESTYCEELAGITIERGWMDKAFVTNRADDSAQLVNPVILLMEKEIQDLVEIEAVLGVCLQEGRPLLVIGEMERKVLEVLAMNHAKGILQSCVIVPPGFGENKKDLMEDLALITGGMFFSASTGDNLQLVKKEDLGRAASVKVTRDKTTILVHPEVKMEGVENRVKELLEQKSGERDPNEKKKIEDRIQSLSSSKGVVYIGAPTRSEKKEIYARAEDAVKALTYSKEDGVLPGGGISLIYLAGQLAIGNTEEEAVARDILNDAVRFPLATMLENDGKKIEDVGVELVGANFGYGYNIKTGQYGDMMKQGIVDSSRAVQEALKNSVSTAVTLLSQQAIIVNDNTEG